MSPDATKRADAFGLRALSNAELLACLGVPSSNTLPTTLRELSQLSSTDLTTYDGVGPRTAARVRAALELGRRMCAEPEDNSDRIRGPGDVFARMGPALSALSQEEFHVLLLNAQHRVIAEVMVTRGILDASLIHPREVFRPAIQRNAAAVVLVHNHPSGDPTPSAEDRAVTRQLEAAGRSLGIPVLDHIVIGGNDYRAFSDQPGGVG